jgi:cyclic dehypoxanthinyl futalosine synthase
MGISRQEALDCLRSDDLLGIGMEADALRRRLHPEGVVTYQCVYEVDASAAAVSIPPWAAALRIRCSDSTGLPAATDLCRSLRASSDSLWLEISIAAETAFDPRTREIIPDWAACGVNSVLTDVRRNSGDYARIGASSLELYRTTHALGMRTSVGIPFGGGESYGSRVDLMDSVRELQEQFGGFVAVVPVAMDAPAGRELDGATAVERLKMLAVIRMYLDTIEHVQSPQVGAGLKVLQTGLRFGADDTELRQPQTGTTEQDLRRVIRDAGLTPIERDGAYTAVFLA